MSVKKEGPGVEVIFFPEERCYLLVEDCTKGEAWRQMVGFEESCRVQPVNFIKPKALERVLVKKNIWLDGREYYYWFSWRQQRISKERSINTELAGGWIGRL
jgi:hypothetical protein